MVNKECILSGDVPSITYSTNIFGCKTENDNISIIYWLRIVDISRLVCEQSTCGAFSINK